MINGPSVYDSGALGTIPPYFKALFSCQNHIQPEKVERCRGHPNHIQRDHLSFFFTVENQFLEGNLTIPNLHDIYCPLVC